MSITERRPDLQPLGLEIREAVSDYIATPLGAKVLYWTGVDGIHYCTLPGYGETVFFVEPLGDPGKSVLPVAGSLTDFLRLLLTHTEAAIQQAYRFSREQFEAFLQAEDETAQQQAVRQQLRELGLAPITDGYGYIRTLQQRFDPSELRFCRAYLDTLPPAENPKADKWKVTWNGGFSRSKGRAAKEVRVDRAFDWNGRHFRIPSVYLCAQGLIMDILQWADPQAIQDYLAKINEREVHLRSELSEEEMQSFDRINPLFHNYEVSAAVNGAVLRQKSGLGCSWMAESLADGQQQADAAVVMEHYGLDKGLGWSIWRVCLPWDDPGQPVVSTLSLRLEWEREKVFFPPFTTPNGEKQYNFTHPVTKQVHVLSVLETEHRTLDPSTFRDQTMDYPTHYTVMEYRLEPALDWGTFSLQDTHPGDQARPKDGSKVYGSMGMVFGMTARSDVPGNRAAASSLTFAARDMIAWQPRLWVQTTAPLEIDLL